MAEKKGKVLCVDDEPNIVRALQWLLQKEFDVVTANSGHDGLALIKQHDFDVVISDQRMPVMTGVEFLREVRKRSPRTMRILLTGYSDYQAILRSVNESEVFRFINKPWNISELPLVVEQAATIARTQPVIAPEPEITEEMPVLVTGNTVLVVDTDPQIRAAVAEIVGDSAPIAFAGSVAEATNILSEKPVAVILSETRIGSNDATGLIRVTKQKHPNIVSVILSSENDAETVTALINQGQVYRFVPKPIRPGYLKLVINSALIKHRQLSEIPELASRHTVQTAAESIAEKPVADVRKTAVVPDASGDPAPAAPTAAGGLMRRLSAGLRRLFN